MKINISAPTQTENGIHVVVTVLNGATEIMSKHINASDYEDLRSQLTNIKTKVKKDALEVAKVTAGEFTAFIAEKVLTDEELKAQEISAKRAELEQELQRAKKDAEITELAKTDTDLADKLAEYNTVLSTDAVSVDPVVIVK